jgi:hypothetical protein
LLENHRRNLRQTERNFARVPTMRVWLFRGLEEQDEDVAGERRPSRRLEVRGKALLAPEDARLM